ncbi:MAG TPA: hypothetical protein PKH22_04765 [Leptospiraceae bacterium]|nr:hypothetical protein [Leptospiraceae bacterium]
MCKPVNLQRNYKQLNHYKFAFFQKIIFFENPSEYDFYQFKKKYLTHIFDIHQLLFFSFMLLLD